MKKSKILILVALVLAGCKEVVDQNDTITNVVKEEVKSVQEAKEELTSKGFEIFDYVDEKTKDTVLMQQYFIAFLKRGPNRSQGKEEADSLQALHMAHLGKMYDEGYADISGPFGDDGDIRGITIYNTPTQAMADSLANADPMVKAGRLVIEIHPWWAAKGFPLR
ncbi:YciI family protein [Maribacter sp. 2308TA10-17]|uniref:YciI family protein n=1 Tax=Maribacter sp. 2308TA10-17 TaxID=3386276 RepID=UPI0039BCF74A